MTELRDLLDHAGGDVEAVDPATVAADLRRGRRALRRHRVARAASPALGAVVVAALGYGVLAGDPAAPGDVPADVPVEVPMAEPEDLSAVRLVTYTGDEVPGYTVAAVPDGWEIQGADEHALVIAPVGFHDQDSGSYRDKLVVLLRSLSDTGTPHGEPMPVGGGTGYLNLSNPGTAILTYTDRGGSDVQIQAPDSLGWGPEELAAFAEGVEVTDAAVAGVG